MKDGDLAATEHHDHTNGVCDLPAEVDKDWWKRERNCNYDFRYTGVHVCCCSMCHGGGGWDVRPGKRQRLDGKHACRNWECEY